MLSLNCEILCFKFGRYFDYSDFESNAFSGYIGSVSFLNTVLDVVSKLRSINPKLTYGEITDSRVG